MCREVSEEGYSDAEGLMDSMSAWLVACRNKKRLKYYISGAFCVIIYERGFCKAYIRRLS